MEQVIENIRKEIYDYLNGLEDKEIFNGAIFVSIKGRKVISKGFGMANFELEVPNSSKIKFRIGSVSKQFTAAAILQLVEEGKLELSDTLDKFISDYPEGNKVTIHHLLTHTSGIYNHTKVEGFEKNIMKNSHTVEELIEEFKNEPYDFKPGGDFSYSNSGYILLGYIIEQLSGQTFEQYLQENIFNKLSMWDSGQDSNKKLIKNRASGYSLEGEEKVLSNCAFIDMSVPYACGGLYSTVEDLYLWNEGLFGGKVISKELFEKMTTKYTHKGEKSGYGYGIFVDTVEVGGKSRKKINHGGGIPGFFSQNSIFPEEDVQVIMITNVASEYFAEKIDRVEEIIFANI